MQIRFKLSQKYNSFKLSFKRKRTMLKYRLKGMSYEEAERQANVDLLKEMLATFETLRSRL